MKQQHINNYPEIFIRLETLKRALLSTETNETFQSQVMNNLIAQVNIIIDICLYKPRLPIYDIEKRIKELYKNDSTLHGVIVQFSFKKKIGDIDKGRLAFLNINI